MGNPKSNYIPCIVYKKGWELLGRLDEAGSTDEFILTAIEGVGEILGAECGVYLPCSCRNGLAGAAPDLALGPRFWQFPIDEERIVNYFSYYYKLDFACTGEGGGRYGAFLRSRLPWEAVNTFQLVSSVKYRDSEFYYDYLKPLGLFDYCCLWLNIGLSPFPVMVFLRPPRSAHFGGRERAILAMLAPRITSSWLFSMMRESLPSIPCVEERRDDAAETGATGLSPREFQVALLFAQGLSPAEIGERLVISWHTVRDHQKNIYRKLGVHNRAALVAKLMTMKVGESIFQPGVRGARGPQDEEGGER